ncbi:RtcB family protein [Shinella sp. CPCC 101442]|uniref:RtcB family protein n=1 Tax=Shinella sp. CPCC 101442 TaxID=2932265 RepID=UPI0021527599|nr:RtcB family protein [Shinella sp. CPCC 101442]MCR6497411.1 RtcB family protein [Shinella sp. CPCC 101442]
MLGAFAIGSGSFKTLKGCGMLSQSLKALPGVNVKRDNPRILVGNDAGCGNHFCELQAVENVSSPASGIDRQSLYLLVHSGSRGFGARVFSDTLPLEPDLMSGSMSRLRPASIGSACMTNVLPGHRSITA